MKATLSNRVALALGGIVACLSLLTFPAVLRGFHRDPLTIGLQAPDISSGPTVELKNTTSQGLHIDGQAATGAEQYAAGLHYLQWQRSYRGGHNISVGHTQLVGPFQDANSPPCSTHLLIGQDFLDGESDEGRAPGTLAEVIGRQVEHELDGMSIWPVGSFQALSKLDLRWVRWQEGQIASIGQSFFATRAIPKLTGHLHISMTLGFEKARVPMILTLIPRLEDGELKFEILVAAELKLDNRFYQWVVDLFDGNDQASQIISEQIGDNLRLALDKPPPIPLGEGALLELEFCANEQITFHNEGHVSVPLAIQLQGDIPGPPLANLKAGPSEAMHSPLALEIDQNGMNALIHALWSSKILDRQLGSSLVQAFNEQETVRDFLSLRLASAVFHLPPTIEFKADSPGRFALRAAASARVRDGQKETEARLFSEISFGIDMLQLEPDQSPALQLSLVELSCLPETGLLKACYGQILEQVRANQEPLQGMLANSFSDLLRRLLTEREIGDANTPVSFHLEGVRFRSAGGRLRAELLGQLGESTM